MSSAFFDLNVAVRGLFTAQKSLDIVNHNLNNVNTPGYSRQVANQTAANPLSLRDGTGMLGTGSDIVSVERVRDEYLDFKYWSESVFAGEWSIKTELLSEIEATFGEPSDSGFTKVLNDFYDSLQELSKEPDSGSIRAVVQQRAVSLTQYFNNTATRFERLQSDINQRIRIKVDEVNTMAEEIARLNEQIYFAELDGNKANDLRDRRTLLVDKMSKIINVEAYEVTTGTLPSGQPDKRFNLVIGGKAIVDHFNASKLTVVQRDDKLNETDVPNLYEIEWEDGNTLNLKGGELKGLMDVRDGNDGQVGTDGTTETPSFKGIPFYMRELNQFVRVFARAFNEGYLDNNTDGVIDAGEDLAGHVDGYGIDPDDDGPLGCSTGIRFFTMTDENGKNMDSATFINGKTDISEICDIYDGLTAKNFCVSADILEDYNKIAASDTDGQAGNAENLMNIIEMRHNKHMFSEGSPEDYMKSMVAALGIDSQQAVTYEETQEAIINQIENRRLSVSGVSINEEMTNMVKFQHAYSAAAKMITTLQEVYDILINRTGV